MTSFCCRSCGDSRGKVILDLGLQPLANNLLRPGDLQKNEPRFPLRLTVCHGCWLMQIFEDVPPVDLFSEYLYFSSFSDTMLEHARRSVDDHIKRFNLGRESLVVEVASNDGYLLQNFVRESVPCVGVEPAANIAKVAREKGIETLVEFFGPELAARLARERGNADLILGNNVFAHVPDINGFASALRELLKPNGVAVLEFPYGVDFIEKNEFDTIYHEHLFYFTLLPLTRLFARHSLQIFDAAKIAIHGGSLRIYVCQSGAFPVVPAVERLLRDEQNKGMESAAYYEKFTAAVDGIKNDLRALIAQLRAEGKTVAAYGASAKGSTLLNFCGLGSESLDFVADRSTQKQGRLTPGTHLPILSPSALIEKMPAYILLLTWNFADEILAQQKEYRDRGGKFILPIPRVQVV